MANNTPVNKLAVIVGSTREGRFGPTVAEWFTALAAEHGGFEVDVIDVAELELPAQHPNWGTPRTPALEALSERVTAADAFVVITPEYNHSYPAQLKHFLDLHTTQWHAKPVAFVSYGGVSGGLRAVEHLRQVFAELHCVTIRDAVSFHGAWDHFAEGGKAHDPQGAAGAAKTLLDRLTWWTTTLREGRTARPYNS
ncbi:NAD(P)H-dependent oxidoreductase [Streptomyces sp. NBC_00536]|uniref:NADPH-dependent FMN reductase n=1 Tax=Streptomyces sp. NBC_00536 TaxID=2975769 RepID=UPI002E802A0A|nr:NAD(P)H-dependent oxidoreductase [Streptomyces sp. NBC_00536]WUC79990.1 NAD(P)H-dependent oxidoreductase [Streptomyces sp. NBC_00536]